MNKVCFVFILIVVFYNGGFAQDNYHNDLLLFLKDNYKIENPSFTISNNENTNLDDLYIYGDATQIKSAVADQSFTQKKAIDVKSAGPNDYNAGLVVKNTVAIAKDDVLLLTFWARKTSNDAEVFIFAEDATNFEKAFYQSTKLTQDWTQYFVSIKAPKQYAVGGLAFGLHIALLVQKFEIAGFTVLNFGKTYNIVQLPSSFSSGNYGGEAIDSPWRKLAATRIESIRKADLTITVKDKNGAALKDAQVKIEMQKHAFGFGSALVSCRIPGNSCYDATYVSKLNNLDGKGHGFNVGVAENDLKWDAWEEMWFGSNPQIVNAIKYFDALGIKMRGHTLFWPGFPLMPDDIVANKNDLPYLRKRIKERIQIMLNHPVLKDLISEWDILNEITVNRDLEAAFKADPNFITGREIYKEIYAMVKATDPNLKKYINEYIVESGGGSSQTTIDRYKSYLTELNNSDVPFDGIGFQCHMGPQLTSIEKMESTFSGFYQQYGKRMSVTEYDMNANVSPTVQAKYLADLLTLTFSHPSMDAFIMWGFWDGNHWKGNAPLYNNDWSLKPSGIAFIDKVFKEWWTNDSLSSDEAGKAIFRPFKGTHKVTITKNGIAKSVPVVLEGNKNIEIILETTSVEEEDKQHKFSVYPNPASKEINIETDLICKPCSLSISTFDGKVVYAKTITENKLNLPLNNLLGSYIITVKNGKYTLPQLFVVN